MPIAPFPADRFLSLDECQTLIKRVTSSATGGGETTIFLNSSWTGNLRWARNQISSAGDVRDNRITIARNIDGAMGSSTTNAVDDRHLRWTLQRAERQEVAQTAGFVQRFRDPAFREPYPHPKIWFDTTYHQDAGARADLLHHILQPIAKAGMLSAGYIQVSATGQASMDHADVWYYPYTQTQCTITVRDPQGTGSGWAGVDWNDWSRIDTEKIAATAVEKCLRSRNPVRLEPGRYTTILEPQAVGDLTQIAFGGVSLSRVYAEFGDPLNPNDRWTQRDFDSPFQRKSGVSMIGEKVIDERLTVRQDDMDPDLGFSPFEQPGWGVYHGVTWIENGILKNLSYERDYAVKRLGQNTGGLLNYADLWISAFHMSATGPTASINEMIATTTRGVLVTRFSNISLPPLDPKSLLVSGYTRDGTWLIENGKISHPIKNFRFTESPLFVLNNVEQIGVPQRIFSPKYPIVVPALKVRDFSFTGLSDAV